MDNYNNQYDSGGQQYQPGYGQAYNTYNSYSNMGNLQPGSTYAYETNVSEAVRKSAASRILTLSFVLGMIGSITMIIGLMMPAIDFSHFHSDVDIQYNLFKVGKNVGLISAMWNAIPYAIVISIIIMAILSFVRIPILKLLPAILILCMLVLMLIDMGNVAAWAADMLDKVGIVLEKEITAGEIMKSLMPGIYILVVGWIISIVSCFVKIKD